MKCLKKLHHPWCTINHHFGQKYASLYLPRSTFASTIDQNEFLQILKAHNSDRKQNPPPKSDEKHVEHLIDQIRTLHASNPDVISSELALNTCSFITHYHTDKALSLSEDNTEALMKFQEIHQKDMDIGWNLLNISDGDAFDTDKSMWKIEMATRLEDTLKIYTSFMQMYTAMDRDFNNFTENQLMIAMSTVPYIGQWSSMLKLAEIINNKMPGAFVSFYHMAQTLPIPDFTMIYELVKQNETTLVQNEINIDNFSEVMNAYIEWNMYDFEGVRLKFNDVQCYKSMDDMSIDTEKESMIRNNMDETQQWNDVELNEDCILRKMGGIVQAKSFYTYGDMLPLQLYGPWMKDRINVKGKVDIPIFNEEKGESKDGDEDTKDDIPAIVVIHEEEWDLEKDMNDDKLFKGKYIVRQRNEILDEENVKVDSDQMKNFGPMDWVYDIEINVR